MLMTPLTPTLPTWRPRSRPRQRSAAGTIAPELVLLILTHIRHPHDTLPDAAHVLPTLRAVPLVCKAWHDAGTEMLYQRIVFTVPSSRQPKLLTRSLLARPRLGALVQVLCFPQLRFRVCDYYRNERSSLRLRNYAALIALCPALIFLRLPTNLDNALSPRPVPALPLRPVHTESLLSLHLTAHPAPPESPSAPPHPSLLLLPIHTSFPHLVHLTLAHFTLTLDLLPAHSRLLFPSLPALRSLTLTACILDARAATQIFTSLRPTLTHLELWQSGYLPELSDAAFRILGPTLETLVIDEFLYEYHIVTDPAFAIALPALRTLKLAAESLSSTQLRHLPPSLDTLKITALPVCACSSCTKHHALNHFQIARSDEMAVALAQALAHNEFTAHALARIVLAGRCAAWKCGAQLLEARCEARGIALVWEAVDDTCPTPRTPLRQRVDALVRRSAWPLRKVGVWWEQTLEGVAW
ncbi:hypothetical protein K439DRAFT_554836 [Ramaria rubella]|nr:hypothetical protein K439DRAFT_554836 [Ramaria rubella]